MYQTEPAQIRQSPGLLLSRWWPLSALFIAALMLASAWSFQIFGHLNPCHLCLKQRDIYWIALAVAMVGSVWALFTGAKGPPRVFSFVLFAVFAVGAAIALYHAGVELKWWRGPETCTAGNEDISIDKMAAFIAGAVNDTPQCDIAAWRMFGISMAGYNAIISAILAVISFAASLRLRRRK